MTHRICSIDGCTNPHAARGWCKRHYYCWKRNGDPEGWKKFYDPREAFEARTEWQGECLVWTGSIWPSGYGVMKVDGKNTAVHRYAYELTNGKIPKGLVIDHSCHNPPCCNVEHLRLATIGDNNSNLVGTQANNRNSGVRNVYGYGAHGKFYVLLRKGGQAYYFGVHDTVEDAAKVAQDARRRLFGEFAGRA